MKLIPKSLLPNKDYYLPLLKQLETLFQEMDRTYTKVADQYGFRCNGCIDNCCLTRFYHHTLLEYLYLKEAMDKFVPDRLQMVREQAMKSSRQMEEADRTGRSVRVMCPLNQAGRCITYRHRPMICRLHGIPHELHRPDGRIIKNPGCDAFFDQCRNSGKSDYIPFDRTPFYRQMVMLENELRQHARAIGKIKLTIAQMLVMIVDEIHIPKPYRQDQ